MAARIHVVAPAPPATQLRLWHSAYRAGARGPWQAEFARCADQYGRHDVDSIAAGRELSPLTPEEAEALFPVKDPAAKDPA